MPFFQSWLKLIHGSETKLCLSVLCGLLFAVVGLMPPLFIRRIIQWVTDGGGSGYALVQISACLCVLYVARGLFRYGYGRFSHEVSFNVLHTLMVRVYSHLQKLPHQFFQAQQSGGLIARSINDIEAIEDFIAHGVPETVNAIVLPTAMIAVLLYLNWQLALVALIPLPLASWIVCRSVSKAREDWRPVRGRLEALTAQVQDNLSGYPVIKSFVQETVRARMVEQRSKRLRDDMLRASMRSFIPVGIIEVTSGLGVVLVVLVGGVLALGGGVSAADLFIFVVYLAQIYQPFLQLASINDTLQKAVVSSERVFELLAVRPDIANASDCIRPNMVRWDVSFKNVTFGYRADTPVIRDVSLEIDEGSLVALVGETGAGKSTITNLIPRFYDTGAGSVRIGGYDVRSLDLNFLRENVAMVLQDVFLFQGTIRQNLLFGRPKATDQEVLAAARAANMEEFVARLPDGYETIVGERGVRLSAGQKQRVSIARALLKDAPILVLDEATSSVDTETEHLIQEAISRLTAQRTTLAVAHRLSTIRDADLIVVLRNGQIIEQGTHQTLLDENGKYARMVRAQQLSLDWRVAGKQTAGDRPMHLQTTR